MMTGENLEKLLQEGMIDADTLMQECAKIHAQREVMSRLRQVWQRSGARAKLDEQQLENCWKDMFEQWEGYSNIGVVSFDLISDLGYNLRRTKFAANAY